MNLDKLPYRIAGLLILLIEALVINAMYGGPGYVDIITALATIFIVGCVTVFALILIIL